MFSVTPLSLSHRCTHTGGVILDPVTLPSTLTSITMQRCAIRTLGDIRRMSAIHCLEHLDVSHNEIEEELLVSLLPHTLTSLVLANNKISKLDAIVASICVCVCVYVSLSCRDPTDGTVGLCSLHTYWLTLYSALVI